MVVVEGLNKIHVMYFGRFSIAKSEEKLFLQAQFVFIPAWPKHPSLNRK